MCSRWYKGRIAEEKGHSLGGIQCCAYSATNHHYSPGQESRRTYRRSITGSARARESGTQHTISCNVPCVGVDGQLTFGGPDAPAYQLGQKGLAVDQGHPSTSTLPQAPRFIGPFTILKQVNLLAGQPGHVQAPATTRVPHSPHISWGTFQPPLPLLLDDGTAYKVKEILDSRRCGGQLEYLVDWEGYGPEERSWVPRNDTLDPNLLETFHAAHPHRPFPSWKRTLAVTVFSKWKIMDSPNKFKVVKWLKGQRDILKDQGHHAPDIIHSKMFSEVQQSSTMSTLLYSHSMANTQRLYFLRRLRKAHLPPPILSMFCRGTTESVLSSCITAWFGNCTVSDRKTLQRIVRTAEKIIGLSLPSITDMYTTRCIRKANSIMDDPTHPSHTLFTLLPSGKSLKSISEIRHCHWIRRPEVGCELEEKERFWSELDEVMESIPTGERVVIGADFNGHVGEGNTGDEEVMGKFGVKERNLEGQMVVDFAKRMDMAVVNTYFQKREEHRVTYKSGGRRTQVDYILCRRGNLKEISDCKVVVGESVARQHRMVVCRMTLMVCKKKRSKIEKKTKWWKLKKEECCEEFRQKLRQALGGQVLLPDDWETTAKVIRETGRKVLGVSSGRRKEDKETWWWNEEVQDSIQRKRLAKKKWDMDRTEENRQEYKELQRRVKREVSKAKQKAYDELYTRLDTREGEKDLTG
ncbi:hypothetical protein QTP70_007044 [Hemibagrus guttatus]|uniref:Chromo domain-containing protein n=1 Tax=Hemibagrus guttatus TaxID=175788 RepID=A0AAE0VCG5_9TELE|nr:hypothetical protein QTP70_007044 [Hemibagrus guttatus]